MRAQPTRKKVTRTAPTRAGARAKIVDALLNEKADSEYYAYGVATIEDRAIQGSIDGLKPVMRRSLWASYELGLRSTAKADKAAKVVGWVLGNYHPHGDTACISKDTLIPLLSGKSETIKELCDRNAGKRWVLAYDELNNSVVPAIAHSWREAKVTKKMLCITLSSGEYIEVTHEHPFYVESEGWVEAGHLECGDSLVGGTFSNFLEYPTIGLNTCKVQRMVHHISGDMKFGGKEKGEVYHHANERTTDNRPANIELLTRGNHALHHGDYLTGLDKGRQTMFGSPRSKMRQAVYKKNSTLLKTHNEWLWLLKAIKIVNFMKLNRMRMTEKNYDIARLTIYNGTTRKRLLERGITFKQLLKLSTSFKLDTSAACGLTKALKEKKKQKKWYNLPKWRLGLPSAFFYASSKVFKQLLTEFDIQDINWPMYRSSALRMPSVSSNDARVKYTHPSFIKRKFQVSHVEEFASKLPARILNVIISIERITLDTSETFYDFTVDKYANMLVYTSSGLESGNVIAVHNCYGAIVNAANSPMALIHGIGNWGTMVDPPAAYRYTACKLSTYADIVFFNRFYLPAMETVQNYDGSKQEPLNLPTLLPNNILNGNFGITPGVQTRTPSYTLESVFPVLRRALVEKRCSAKMCYDLEFISKYGGVVYLSKEMRPMLFDFYKSGKGGFIFDSVETGPTADNEIRIARFAPIANISKTLAAVESIQGVIGTRDDGDKTDKYKMAYVVKLAKNLKGQLRDAVIDKVMDKFSSKVTFSVQATNRVLTEEGYDAKLFPTSVPGLINIWIEYRLDLEVRACTYWINKRKLETEDLNLLRLAVKMRDVILKALSKRITDDELVTYLSKVLSITPVQANRILDLKVRQLRALEDRVLVEKLKALATESAGYEARRKDPRSYVLQQLDELELALLPKPKSTRGTTRRK